MCRREVIKLHKVTIPIDTTRYQNPSVTYSGETLYSIEVSESLECTRTNHVFYKRRKPEG
jgi:hypothetical protein